MAFKSKAQRDKCKRMLDKGQIDQETFDRWNEGTPEKLPDRLHPKKEEAPREKTKD